MIERIYRTVLEILNKEQRGYVTAEEFNDYAQQAQREIFEGYFYELGRAVIQYGPMMDEFSNIPDHIMEKLQPFYTEATVTDGVLPSDLYRLGEVFFCGTTIVDPVPHKMIRYVVNAPLTAPTEKQPVYTRTGNNLRVYPETILQVDIEYIHDIRELPQISVIAINGDQQITVVNDFELVNSEEPELVAKILAYAGVSVRAVDVASAATQKEQSINQMEQ